MPDEMKPTEKADASHLLLIVVGAHLRAEMADRPLAYALQGRIRHWLERHDPSLNIRLFPLVCCDVWYLNQPMLQKRPVISVGGPGVNALSAYFADKLPAAMIRENQMVIQLDKEFVDLRCCIWGMNHELTEEVVDLFTEEYLDSYLRAVVTQVEPAEE